MRIGYGIRHPELIRILDRLTPVSVFEDAWADGALMLKVSAYVCADIELPDELITSVRCVVDANDQVVVCRAPNELHALPGGRRENAESLPETAVREVYEETGWHLDADSLGTLGFIHLEIRNDPPAGYPYPHPDFTQLVFGGRATHRDAIPDEEWLDSAGWEQGSFLATKDAALGLDLTPISVPFVRAYEGDA